VSSYLQNQSNVFRHAGGTASVPAHPSVRAVVLPLLVAQVTRRSPTIAISPLSARGVAPMSWGIPEFGVV
jgi:hypothetical protein